jgi:hypothetical protein
LFTHEPWNFENGLRVVTRGHAVSDDLEEQFRYLRWV